MSGPLAGDEVSRRRGAQGIAPRAALAAWSRRALRAEPVAMAVCAVVVCALYFWTAHTTVHGTPHYDLLADAFLDGQTNLPVEAPAGLLALRDPYDPELNAPYRGLHDVSFSEGRFYLYFGPTPVFLVHLPLRAVGVKADDALATSILASAGFLFALALMRFLIARYRPQTSLMTRTAAALLLGLANVAPFVLRRPAVWEVAITAGYCCLAAALYLTLTGALRARPSLARLAGGSLALGLAAGARPHLLLAAPVFAWAWHRAWRVGPSAQTGPRPGWSLAGAVLGPLAVCLALLGSYNLVRFGSLTEFGQSFQLSGIRTSAIDRFDLGRLGPGLFSYLAAPPKLDLVFPFAHLDATWTGVALPADYLIRMEPVAGALATTPVLLLALLAPWQWAAGDRARREPMALASLLLLAGVLVLAVPLLSFNGATMRYEMDWVTLVLLSALLVWLRVEDLLAGRRLARAVVRVLAAAAAAAAIVLALAFSVTGYVDGLRLVEPDTFARLRGAFGFVPTLASRIQGEPVVLGVRPEDVSQAPDVVLSGAPPGTPTALTRIQLAAPSGGVVDLRADIDANPALPPGSIVVLAVEGTDRTVRRVPLARRVVRLRAGLRGGGLQDVRIRWRTVRYGADGLKDPGTPPGFLVSDVRVVRWSPD